MKSSLRSFGIIIVLFLFALGMVTLLISHLDSVEAASFSSSIDQDEYTVDNSDGLMLGRFESLLTIENDGDPVNVTIKFSQPEGEEWKANKNVYPHIFSDTSRRKDKGHKYYVELQEGKNKFYPRIDVNESAFADTYSFKLKVESKSGEFAPDIDITVLVTPYNDIVIELDSTDDKEKAVTAGKATIVSVVLKNEGNIYNEVVDIEVFDEDGGSLPSNLTVVEIQFPADRDWVDPVEFGGQYFEISIGIKIETDSESTKRLPDTLSAQPRTQTDCDRELTVQRTVSWLPDFVPPPAASARALPLGTWPAVPLLCCPALRLCWTDMS